MVEWSRPGRRGALIYGGLAALVGGAVAAVAHVDLPRRPGAGRVRGQLPAGPVIVIANQTSMIDGVLLALACRDLGRQMRLLSTAGVFKSPVLGPILRELGFIPVHRGSSAAADSLVAAEQALAAGECVALFPEGGITSDPAHWPLRAKTGAVRLAQRTGAPVVPIAFDGAYRVVGADRHLARLVRNLTSAPQVRVLVGEPIDVRALTSGHEDEATVREVSDAVMGTLIDLVEELRGQQAEHGNGIPTT